MAVQIGLAQYGEFLRCIFKNTGVVRVWIPAAHKPRVAFYIRSRLHFHHLVGLDLFFWRVYGPICGRVPVGHLRDPKWLSKPFKPRQLFVESVINQWKANTSMCGSFPSDSLNAS